MARASAFKAQHRPDTLGAVLADVEDRRDWLSWATDERDSGRDPARWIRGHGGQRHALRAGTAELVLPEKPIRLVLTGASGAGKTTAAMRIVWCLLTRGHRVLYLDGKGDHSDAEQLLDMAAKLGVASVRWPDCPYDGWRGSAADCVEKALMLTGVSETDQSSAALFYRNMAEETLHAVSADRPWGTTAEMLERLRTPSIWVRDTRTLTELNKKARAGTSTLDTVTATMRAAIRPLVGVLDGRYSAHGWSWDEASGTPWDLAVCSITEDSHRRAAAVILTDLNQWRLNPQRKPPDARPLTVVLDEAQTILDDLVRPPRISQYAEQFRSAGIGLIVSTQSPAGLGEQGQRLLSSGADILTGRLNDAEELIKRAGTRKMPEWSYRPIGLGDGPEEQTAREQDQLRLDPERLKEAGRGIFVLVESGQPVRWAAICPIPEELA